MKRLIITFLAMFLLAAVMVAGLGFYAQRTAGRLSGHTARVLRDNYDSIRYMDLVLSGLADGERLMMGRIAQGGHAPKRPALPLVDELRAIRAPVDRAVGHETDNVTLPGEDEAAGRLKGAVGAYHDRLFAVAEAIDKSTTSSVSLLLLYEQEVEPLRVEAGRWAQAIRRMNHEHMEKTASEHARSAPRFILLGTLIAVGGLLAGGLQLARRMYRQAREFQALRTHFLAIASHELRTPVTSLKMGLDLLSSETVGPTNDEQRRVIEAGVEDCDRLLTLARQLLDVTRIQSGQIEVHRVAVELGVLLADAVKAVRRSAQDRRITIGMDVDADASGRRVDADPTKATWVVTNLLVNALRYAPVDGTVRVSARLVSHGMIGRKEVAVSVSDSGPGIPAELARKVFQPYFQAGGKQDASGKGEAEMRSGSVGLGLAIAQEIVAAHGGRIWVEAVPLLGCGATVTFTLPLSREEA